MRLKVSLVLVLAIGVWALLAASASAVTEISLGCGEVAELAVTPDHGLPGSSAKVTGTEMMLDETAEFYFDTESGLLGSTLADLDGNISFDFDVPADAEPGPHEIYVVGVDSHEHSLECPIPFTVDEASNSASQDTYLSDPTTPGVTAPAVDAPGATAPVTSLPNTGFALLVPAAGLAMSGIGTLTIRRRKRR